MPKYIELLLTFYEEIRNPRVAQRWVQPVMAKMHTVRIDKVGHRDSLINCPVRNLPKHSRAKELAETSLPNVRIAYAGSRGYIDGLLRYDELTEAQVDALIAEGAFVNTPAL